MSQDREEPRDTVGTEGRELLLIGQQHPALFRLESDYRQASANALRDTLIVHEAAKNTRGCQTDQPFKVFVADKIGAQPTRSGEPVGEAVCELMKEVRSNAARRARDERASRGTAW